MCFARGAIPGRSMLRLRFRFAFTDLDPAALRSLFGQREANFEDAVLHLGADRVSVDPLGKRDQTLERTVAPLAAKEPALAFLVLLLVLSFEDQALIGHLELDVLLGVARD